MGDQVSSGNEPTQSVTAVTETLFSLVGQLEDAFLPQVSHAIAEELSKAALRIPALSTSGQRQMVTDLEHCLKVLEALMSEEATQSRHGERKIRAMMEAGCQPPPPDAYVG